MTGANQYPVAGSGLSGLAENSANFVLGHTGEMTSGPSVPLEVNHYSGRHVGGVNFAFADGHVAFLGTGVDYTTIKALSTRAGSETINGSY